MLYLTLTQALLFYFLKTTSMSSHAPTHQLSGHTKHLFITDDFNFIYVEQIVKLRQGSGKEGQGRARDGP